ncbi:hypothetical protein HQ585_17580, partial [candidate division KSB1 bacterium]|nr:hypothetical protein [candidate division KSB1 bacterium]
MKRLQFRMHTIRLLAFFLFIFSMPPPILFAQLPAPPMLLSPDNGAVIGSPNPAFFWTPAQSVPDQLLFYRFRLVLLMSGQNSADAVKTNSPHHEQMMRRQGYQYPTDATPLNIGETYAWGVQVITRDETPMAANGGWTEVYTISIQSPPSAPIIVTTDPIVMTGQRPQSIAVTTDPIIMTGQRSQIIAVTTDPIIMTGQRPQLIAVTTDPIIMTGQRSQIIAVTTDP